MTAPFDPRRPAQTRDGRKARIICEDAAGDFPIIALVKEEDGSEHPESFPSDGRYSHSGITNAHDLINTPEERVFWIGVTKTRDDGSIYTSNAQKSRAFFLEPHPPSNLGGLIRITLRGDTLVSAEVEQP